MFNLIKKKILLIISTPSAFGYCLLLQNQECTVRKVIIGNGYMTFPYKIGVDRCIGSCNDKDNPFLNFVYQIPLKILVLKVSIYY